MKRLALILTCAVAAAAPADEEAPTAAAEVWNSGVDSYRAGDTTNALAILRPLMLSRTHGARAAEVVAKIEYDAAREPGSAEALKHLEEAAAAAQIALRATPDDPRANANFTRATDGLKSLRETKRVNDILAAAKGKSPESILQSGMREARKVLAETAAAGENETVDAAELVRKYDNLSSRVAKLADSWLPVKEAIAAAVTNQTEAAEISARVDAVRQKTADAAVKLEDMDDSARYGLAEAEQEFTDFFKMVAMPPTSIREDLLTQSNAWQDVAIECERPWQNEALDYTRAFRAKFPMWAREYEQQAAADTNKPPFTAEAQAEISDLSTRLEKLQIECVAEALPPKQEEAVEIIRRIIELMPDEKSGGQGGQNQQQNQQDKQDKQDKQEKNDSDKDDSRNQDGQNDEQQQQQEEEKPDDGKEAGEEPQPDEKSQDEKEVEALLRKAQERNDEHEEDKKARARKARLPPNSRDW